MTSSKKKRGKQRKAAKLAAASRDGDGRMQNNRSQQQSELEMSSTGDGMQEINRSERHQIAALVRRGSSIGTAAIISDMSSLMGKNDDAGGPSLSLDVSGLLSTVLRFLKRCEDETFAGVMADV